MRALVKLGGSVITRKEVEWSVNREALSRLCAELAEAWRAGVELVVVHGGGSFPHPVAERFRVHEGLRSGSLEELMGFALTNDAAARLNRVVVASLLEAGVPAVSLQPSASLLARRGRVEEVYGGALRRMLELRLVPVLYGDAVMDVESGFSIASGEALLEALAPLLRPQRIVVCVDVDGVYDKYPGGRLVERVWRGNVEEVVRGLGGARGADVTGGMLHKVEALYRLALKGYPSIIVNGLKPRLVLRALMGEPCEGTVVEP
ncbi:MAG: isopentenyl phosphate kinase [Candidatus Nezhaarchaeales archaeon]